MASPSQSTTPRLEISTTTSGGSLRIDFYCPDARLAIELDGGGHNFAAKESLDQARTRFLASKDIQILLFWNHEISQELDSVLETIWSALEQRRKPSP